MALLTGRFAGHLQMELLRGSVGIVAEHTLGQDFIVVGVTRCKRLLLVAREACLCNSDLLEISWLFCPRDSSDILPEEDAPCKLSTPAEPRCSQSVMTMN